ncbi:MAG: hypothetical protein KDA42_09185 [Planctomycetales bacterium]|nr:hypothetical protein [Planctomycetales bacterium]
MKKICLTLVALAVAATANLKPAQALPPFKKQFQQKYVDDGSDALKDAFKKASCNACHVKGEEKDVQNAYGEALAKYIEGDAKDRIEEAKKNGTDDAEKEKVAKELEEAFKKVEEMKSPSGETYGERLKAGKLPIE